MRPLRPSSVLLAALALCALTGSALTGCASISAGQAAGEAPAPGSTTSATAPAPGTPLTCADLVADGLVASALEPAGGTPAASAEADATPVAAIQPNALFGAAVLTGLGGLDCSWRLGAPQAAIGAGGGGWSYLSIRVLPHAADRWVPLWAGDAPSTETREIAGVQASTAVGETGWRISAPLDDAWVQLEITAAGLTGAGSKYDGLGGAMLDRLAAVAESTFTVLGAATPEQLAWPALELAPVEPACAGELDLARLVLPLGYPSGTSVTYRLRAEDGSPDSIEDVLRADGRLFTCELLADGYGVSEITVARGFAPEAGVLGAPDGEVALHPFALQAPVGDARALQGATMPNGGRSPVYLSAAGNLYEIWSERSGAIAQAIVDGLQ